MGNLVPFTDNFNDLVQHRGVPVRVPLRTVWERVTGPPTSGTRWRWAADVLRAVGVPLRGRARNCPTPVSSGATTGPPTRPPRTRRSRRPWTRCRTSSGSAGAVVTGCAPACAGTTTSDSACGARPPMAEEVVTPTRRRPSGTRSGRRRPSRTGPRTSTSRPGPTLQLPELRQQGLRRQVLLARGVVARRPQWSRAAGCGYHGRSAPRRGVLLGVRHQDVSFHPLVGAGGNNPTPGLVEVSGKRTVRVRSEA